tara:strand:- start:84 stop:485 length:402 start_codon:yes stop_codon:yes gene_type:complete
MSKKNPDTDEILDAIKTMMSNRPNQENQDLPRDVVELTKPIDNDLEVENDKIGILELSNPIGDEETVIKEDRQQDSNERQFINDEQIKKAVRNAINSLPSSKLDQIINEELTKIIKERFNSSKITISSEYKKN